MGKKAKGCEDRNRARWLIHPKPAPEQGRDSWEDAETLSCLPTTEQVIKAEVLFISECKRGRPKRYLAATKLGKKRDVHHAAAVKNYTAARKEWLKRGRFGGEAVLTVTAWYLCLVIDGARRLRMAVELRRLASANGCIVRTVYTGRSENTKRFSLTDSRFRGYPESSCESTSIVIRG